MASLWMREYFRKLFWNESLNEFQEKKKKWKRIVASYCWNDFVGMAQDAKFVLSDDTEMWK